MNKFFAVLIVGFVAVSTVAAKPDCSYVADGVQLPDPNDCGKFYVCSHGEVLEAHCTDGYHFNPVLHFCDLAALAGCSVTSSSVQDCTGQIDGATLSMPGKCSQFFICIDQFPRIAHCPSGLEYSEMQRTCVAPHLSNCVRSTLPPATIAPPVYIPPVVTPPAHLTLMDCSASVDGTRFAMSGECSKFLICIDQVSHVANCPNGLEYSETEQSCVESSMSGCVWATHLPGKVVPPVNPPQKYYGSPDCTAQLDGVSLPMYGECSRYYICVRQVAYSASCENGFEYSEKHRSCVPAGSSGCISSVIVNPPVYPPNHNTALPAGCANKPEGTLIPYPGDCTKYITCIEEGIIKSCPSPLHFNAKQQVCDWPQTAGCI